MKNYAIYINGEYAFIVMRKASAWAAEAYARTLCNPGDRVVAYLAR